MKILKKRYKNQSQLYCSKEQKHSARSQSQKSVPNVSAIFHPFSIKILLIFSDGNAQNENGDVMDTSTLEQTANSLKENFIDMFAVLIPNTEKESRIQQLKSIVSYSDDVIDAGFSSMADLLTLRVKRLVGCLGKNYEKETLSFCQYLVFIQKFRIINNRTS